MSEEHKKVTSGYRLQSVEAHRIIMAPVFEASEMADERDMSFTWDCRFSGERLFDVRTSVLVSASKAVPQKLEIDLVGRFEVIGDEQSLDVEPFAMISATAILLPYLRETLASVSRRGPFEEVTLPILNVQTLMADVSWEKSTAGQQLAKANEVNDQSE